MSTRARYTLETYEADSSERDVLVSYESDYPFPAIRTGDIFRPLGHGEQTGGRILEVRHVEHIVWEVEGGPRFKLCVYTKAVPDHPHDWDDA